MKNMFFSKNPVFESSFLFRWRVTTIVDFIFFTLFDGWATSIASIIFLNFIFPWVVLAIFFVIFIRGVFSYISIPFFSRAFEKF